MFRIVTMTIWVCFMLFLSPKSFGQDWEEVPGTYIDFSGINALGDIPNLSHYGFYLQPYGASGDYSDKAAMANFFFSSASTVYLTFSIDNFSLQYEYRIQCNAKVVNINTHKLQFRHHTQPGLNGTDIGEPIAIPMTSSQLLPGGVIESIPFTGLAGQHSIIIAPDPSNQPASLPVYIDDFKLERRALSSSTTEPSFAIPPLAIPTISPLIDGISVNAILLSQINNTSLSFQT